MGPAVNGCSVLPELRVKDRKERGTVTTGIENRFGAGVEAKWERRPHWPPARGLIGR